MALLITGPQGAGKTTVARLVADRFARGVHVEDDAFLRFVVAGRAEMAPDASADALAQLRLRYAQAGFSVVVDERHAEWVYRVFAEETPRIGDWLDNGHLTPEQTAAAILRA